MIGLEEFCFLMDICYCFICSLLQQNVDEAAAKLRAKGIEVLPVICHVSNAQHRKNLIDKTLQVRLYTFFRYTMKFLLV